MESKIAKLPAWARDYIKQLQSNLQQRTEAMVRELAKLRPEVEVLRARNGALTELLHCAAKGGHVGAADIINAIKGHDLVLTKSFEED